MLDRIKADPARRAYWLGVSLGLMVTMFACWCALTAYFAISLNPSLSFMGRLIAGVWAVGSFVGWIVVIRLLGREFRRVATKGRER